MGIFDRGSKSEDAVRLDMLRDELWRRQDSQGRRATQIETVAGVLISGSALVSTIIAVLPADAAMRVALFCSLVAAVFAMLALMPRQIQEINPRKMRAAIGKTSDRGARFWHTDHLIVQVETREKLIQQRFALVRIGLVFLVATIVFVTISIATNGGEQVGKNDSDAWPDVDVDKANYETVTESGRPDVLLGTAGDSSDEGVIRLVEIQED